MKYIILLLAVASACFSTVKPEMDPVTTGIIIGSACVAGGMIATTGALSYESLSSNSTSTTDHTTTNTGN